MFWKKKSGPTSTAESCAHELFNALADALTRDGRIRSEDLIAAAASIVGERCIEASGSFNVREHIMAPGARVFSDTVNQLFSADSASDEIDSYPAESIVGMLRDKLLQGGYAKSDFPALKEIYEYFAANIGKAEDWGKVPLSVPAENQPQIMPLRVTYESRALVDGIFQPLGKPQEKLRAAVFALAECLIAVKDVIDRKIALLLALQVANGMAKTVPMTDAAMEQLKKNMKG